MTNTPTEDGPLIGTAEVCRIKGVHRSTVKRWVDSGRLTPAQILPGKTGPMLFRRVDVEALSDAPEAPPS